MTYIGVDGCAYGWFFVRLEEEKMTAGISRTLAEIVSSAPKKACVLVDIPIGLRDDTALPRPCDVGARKRLGPRRSSVFPAPIRAMLSEKTHAAASQKNRCLTGKGLSIQTFCIIPRIREVDELLASDRHAQKIVREVHPEVCFWGLAGGNPMPHSKKTKAGSAERMRLLKEALPMAAAVADESLKHYLRKDVARDDIADALVAVVTACAPPESICTLPTTPERDSRGLPMEMVYSCRGSRNTFSLN